MEKQMKKEERVLAFWKCWQERTLLEGARQLGLREGCSRRRGGIQREGQGRGHWFHWLCPFTPTVAAAQQAHGGHCGTTIR